MEKFLATLLQAVIIAAVPVCTAFAKKGIDALAQYFNEKRKNDLEKKYINAAAEAAKKAVTYVNQTYVDALKKKNEFSPENQTEALNKAVDKAVALLTDEAREFLQMAYGDLTTYLAANIEAEVREQKYHLPY